MDPQRAYDALSLAATRSAPLSTGRVCFFEFNDIHATEVRACKSRTDCLSLAKKYVKVWDAIEELEKGLENSPHSARPVCTVHPKCIPVKVWESLQISVRVPLSLL